VARDHPLAQRQSVTLEDLADYAVAQFDTELEEMIEALIPLATPRGRPIPRAPVSPRSLEPPAPRTRSPGSRRLS